MLSMLCHATIWPAGNVAGFGDTPTRSFVVIGPGDAFTCARNVSVTRRRRQTSRLLHRHVATGRWRALDRRAPCPALWQFRRESEPPHLGDQRRPGHTELR